MKPIRMAVVGVGHLGKEHARILAGFPNVELVGVVDLHLPQAQAVAQLHQTQAFADHRELLDRVDAASIVVPTSHHTSVARDFLQRGISLLVEKPLAPTAAEADELNRLARNHHAVLQVGHIERFNPAFERLHASSLSPRFIRAQRMGPFTGRSTDIGVVLDLMIHDLDLILTLVGSQATLVSAWGQCVFGGHEDIANARIEFANGCVADVTASRAHPTPVRQMQAWSPDGWADLDFAQRKCTLVRPTEAVKHRGLDPSRLPLEDRKRIRDELFTKHLLLQPFDGQQQDQLSCELRDFVDCVRQGTTPRVDGSAGREAVALAERIVSALQVTSESTRRAA